MCVCVNGVFLCQHFLRVSLFFVSDCPELVTRGSFLPRNSTYVPTRHTRSVIAIWQEPSSVCGSWSGCELRLTTCSSGAREWRGLAVTEEWGHWGEWGPRMVYVICTLKLIFLRVVYDHASIMSPERVICTSHLERKKSVINNAHFNTFGASSVWVPWQQCHNSELKSMGCTPQKIFTGFFSLQK